MSGKFVPAASIKVNDTLLTFDSKKEKVYKIEFVSSSMDVYDITVDGNHNYYADNYLVHNKEFYIGQYRGSDELEEARIEADKRAWEATLKVMQAEDEKVRTEIENAQSKFGLAKEEYDITGSTLRRESRTNVEQAESAIGKTGLISGGGERTLEDVYAGIETAGQEMSLGMQSRQQDLQSGIDAAIAASEATKASLYAQYVTNMASSYSVVPDAPDTGAVSFALGGESGDYVGSVGGSYAGVEGEDEGIFTCLSGDTVINTANSTKEISRLNVGDTVKTYNLEKEVIEENKVTNMMVHEVDKIMIINDNIKVTGNHLVFIEG